MQKYINIIVLTFFLAIIPLSVQARSGCCSHHQGVCGCGCCDGTPLSLTCAPYYPECSGGKQEAPVQREQIYYPPTIIPKLLPTNTPYPTSTPTPIFSLTTIPLATTTLKISKKPVIKKVTQQNTIKKSIKKSFWQWLFNTK